MSLQYLINGGRMLLLLLRKILVLMLLFWLITGILNKIQL